MITCVPANEGSWEDLQAVLGSSDPGRCQCMRYKLGQHEWTPEPWEVRAARLREETAVGDPASPTTSGLLAYLDDGTPVGWCAVEPRRHYERLLSGRLPVPWKGRDEDRDDPGVWAITCLVTRKGHRRTGVSAALVAAAVPFARSRGARALEGYPMTTVPGRDVTWGELHVGARSSFAAAGFTEVSHPTPRRFVMRVEL